ncbi:TPA: hypothetical protein N0F65_003009 [Lagenidium giganteum]|uniref:3'-5' exonuclease domain-containing protein n=1 Tax=Lagenidium giganteum TaxID=4803 RepID=A0AAV2YSU0_9STRA|nr:TPA: hypothetical protein N0F65_003009 [Lagenidium giganteum]
MHLLSHCQVQREQSIYDTAAKFLETKPDAWASSIFPAKLVTVVADQAQLLLRCYQTLEKSIDWSVQPIRHDALRLGSPPCSSSDQTCGQISPTRGANSERYDKVEVITTNEHLLRTFGSKHTFTLTSSIDMAGVHFQMERDDTTSRDVAVALVLTATRTKSLVLDLRSLDKAMVMKAVKTLALSGMAKVCFDADRALHWLHQELGNQAVKAVNWYDLCDLVVSDQGKSPEAMWQTLMQQSRDDMPSPDCLRSSMVWSKEWTHLQSKYARKYVALYCATRAKMSKSSIGAARNQTINKIARPQVQSPLRRPTTPVAESNVATSTASRVSSDSTINVINDDDALKPCDVTALGTAVAISPVNKCAQDRGATGCPVAVVLASHDRAVIVNLQSVDTKVFATWLRKLLENPLQTKIMHDIHHFAHKLHQLGLSHPELQQCIDLQLHYESAVATLQSVAEHVGVSFPASDYNRFAVSSALLTQQVVDIAVAATRCILQCYIAMEKDIDDQASQLPSRTSLRWRYAANNRGRRAFWFDEEDDFQPRSLALVAAKSIPSLALECDLEPLLDLLPYQYLRAIDAIPLARHTLVDVILDVGRVPHVYLGRSQRSALAESSDVVKKQDLGAVIEQLGGLKKIGLDNRAGIDRQLHRISVMRSKTGEIYGLTIRVGRSVRNSAAMLRDLLLSERHRHKSVLLLLSCVHHRHVQRDWR